MFSKEKTLFVTKVTLAHVFTYFLCGFIFMNLLDYSEFIEALGFKNMDEISGMTVILGQIVRGVLFGIVVWLIKDSIIGKRLAWLKLWVILVIVGIISVYAPAFGFVYKINLSFSVSAMRGKKTIKPVSFKHGGEANGMARQNEHGSRIYRNQS